MSDYWKRRNLYKRFGRDRAIQPTSGIGVPMGKTRDESSPVVQNSEETIVPGQIRLRLTQPHPLIGKTEFKCDARNSNGHAMSNDHEGVDTRVSRGQFRVALAILDRLFKALGKEGLTIHNEQHNYRNRRGTYVFRGNSDSCQVYVEEEFRRVEHVPTAKEKAEQERYSFSRPQRWDYVPTGELTLHPGGMVDLSNQEALDDLIKRSVTEVLEEIEQQRMSRVAREEKQHREAEERRREEEEKQRVESLHKSADALHRYRLLMEYIEEVRRHKRIPSNQLRDGQTLAEWIRWAEAQARAVHPLGHRSDECDEIALDPDFGS
jgi:hypothetical protein